VRRYPVLYQINAAAFVNQLSVKYGRPLTLAGIPDVEWQTLAELGFDFIWMMGVWQRSPAARRLALNSEGLRKEFDRILPGWTAKDVSGSPYAIFSYHLDSSLGGEDELADLKNKLNSFGLGLILDFVPNHLAIDHPWTLTHPERFVRGKMSDTKKHPDWFFNAGEAGFLAHGRDPYFTPWNDTAQVNFFSDSLRQALLSELDRISDLADGLRCDMAMLALNEVFERVWGEVVGDSGKPPAEFWAEAIDRVKERHPSFVFLAEVYWGLDRQLQQTGFDFTYDKPFYDHLLHGSAGDITEHLRGESGFIEHQAHFIENHDETRAVTAFGKERSLAAAVTIATIPGIRFYQHGQLDGRQIRIPVQLAVEPVETIDRDVARFYRRLLSSTNNSVFHEGEWHVIETAPAWEGNGSHRNVLAWKWIYQDQWNVIIVNYSAYPAQAWIKLNRLYEFSGQVSFEDVFTGIKYVRDTTDLTAKGLYIDLLPYHTHFLVEHKVD
jgi:glycosidase